MEVSVQVQAEKSTRWRSREHEVEKMGLTWSQLGKTRWVGGHQSSMTSVPTYDQTS